VNASLLIRKIKLKSFNVISEIVVIMGAVYKNKVIFSIILILIGLVFSIIGVALGVYWGFISPAPAQATPVILIIITEYVGIGILLSALAYRQYRRNVMLLEKTELIKKDTDKEDLGKIQSIIIEKLEESIDKTEGDFYDTQKR